MIIAGATAQGGGAAVVFRRTNGVWMEEARLAPGDPDTDRDFGGGAAYAFDLVACICRGDINRNGYVTFADLYAVLAAWGPCQGCAEDADDDGEVGYSDVLVLLASWGPCP